MQTLQIKQLSPNATLPTRTHTTDSGLDIYAAEDTLVVTGTKVPTGVAVNIPEGYEGTIRPRSGKTSKTRLRVQLGTIDSGYTGELKVIADSYPGLLGLTKYFVEKGEKIAQLVISPIVTPQLEIVDQFDTQSERGEKGFGSSDLDCSGIEVRNIDTNQMTEEQIKQMGDSIETWKRVIGSSDEVHP